MIIRIDIPIEPKAQKRDKIAAIGGRARSYKDSGQRLSEQKLLSFLLPHRPPLALTGPISLNVSVYVAIPKSKPRIWREKALRREIRPITRPDIDNYLKQILDVMNGIFFLDDRQVVDIHGGKWYGENPHWEIILSGQY